MEDNSKKQQFIELRAQGLSFVKISDKINVSKPTLIKWSKEFDDEIMNLKTIEFEALCEQYCLQKENRIMNLGKYLTRLGAEIEKRDLSKIPTDQLFKLFVLYLKESKVEVDTLAFQHKVFGTIYPRIEKWES